LSAPLQAGQRGLVNSQMLLMSSEVVLLECWKEMIVNLSIRYDNTELIDILRSHCVHRTRRKMIHKIHRDLPRFATNHLDHSYLYSHHAEITFIP
jgi:hypothetical protein